MPNTNDKAAALLDMVAKPQTSYNELVKKVEELLALYPAEIRSNSETNKLKEGQGLLGAQIYISEKLDGLCNEISEVIGEQRKNPAK